MRKFIVSNSLLLMFMVGAASGFCVSSAAWWSLSLNERGLWQVYRTARDALAPDAAPALDQAFIAAQSGIIEERAALLALSLLASLFFCGTAWLTWRQSRERRRQALALARQHALFRTLFDGARDAILLLQNEQIIDSNPAALRLFGVASVGQFAGLPLDALQPDAACSGPALRARLAGDDASFVWRFQSLDGRAFTAEVTLNSAFDGRQVVLQLSVRDITHRIEAERSMLLANQAFENSLEGIAITDADRNILSVNRAFTTITGYSAGEVVGRNPRILKSGRQSPEFYAAMWGEIGRNHEWHGEVWNRRKNGEIYPQWMSITEVRDAHGVPVNYVAVFSDISELKAAHARTLHAVSYDQLTSLPNRALFTDRLNQLFTRAGPAERCALLFIDLDRLKVINDSMGRDAGDDLLRMVAARLAEDVPDGASLGRMNGDEFAILLARINHADDAALVAQAILQRFEEPFTLEDAPIYVSLSIGISVYPDDGCDPEALLANASLAMHRAKKAGGVTYATYVEELGTRASERLAIETGLRKALERNELEVHYQPQFECADGRLSGFEALLRWRHPELGLVPPGVFLAVAEETGLIVPIGAWVLRTACEQAQAWRRAGAPDTMMAVNLSARQLQHPDIIAHVTGALEESGLPAHLLELEITESMMMQKIDACIALMHHLAALGVEFAIDDFGTGYSSLAYLKRMPIKALKIDQSFIRDITTNTDGANIVGAIVAMSHTLGLRVVAEGIEDQAQLAHLQAYRGIIGQGYLLGRPAPAPALEKVLGTRQAQAA
ncbi:MAG TPA: EAL domain-containing protein [Telluria sp.]|nr:EAL domain-containing protein [Telluria sp.]